jgi:hypothetical protein
LGQIFGVVVDAETGGTVVKHARKRIGRMDTIMNVAGKRNNAIKS